MDPTVKAFIAPDEIAVSDGEAGEHSISVCCKGDARHTVLTIDRILCDRITDSLPSGEGSHEVETPLDGTNVDWEVIDHKKEACIAILGDKSNTYTVFGGGRIVWTRKRRQGDKATIRQA